MISRIPCLLISILAIILSNCPRAIHFKHFHSDSRYTVSLSCHFDELLTLLPNLNISFDVVAVSETWDSFERPLNTNVEIPGYTFLSSNSLSQNSGVGLKLKLAWALFWGLTLTVTVRNMKQCGLKWNLQKKEIFWFVLHIVIQVLKLKTSQKTFKKHYPNTLF